ncbi:MAG: hypothetical protein P8080_04530 [Gammaproteobacteria bacterium]
MSHALPETALACVVRRLPGLKGAIEVEFSRNAAFRGLCDDYCLCADAAAGWETSDAPAAAARRQEYARWLSELENEIVEWLKNGLPADRGGPQ